MQPLEKVESAIETSLQNLAGLHTRMNVGINPFLEAISEDVAKNSSLTRSITSKLGNSLQKLARELAKSKYGEELVPDIVFQKDIYIDDTFHAAHSKDTKVVSKIDKRKLDLAADALVRFAGESRENRIGTFKFRNEFKKTMKDLTSNISGETNEKLVDFFADVPKIGFCELESGGQLDTSNGPAQPRKLVMAALSSGKPEVGMHFSLAYANRGEGNLIAGGLTRIFVSNSESETGDGLLIGKEWWETLLPDGVTYTIFMESFKKVVDRLDIV